MKHDAPISESDLDFSKPLQTETELPFDPEKSSTLASTEKTKRQSSEQKRAIKRATAIAIAAVNELTKDKAHQDTDSTFNESSSGENIAETFAKEVELPTENHDAKVDALSKEEEQNELDSQSDHSEQAKPSKKQKVQVNFGALLWDLVCVAALIAAGVFGVLWYQSNNKAKASAKVIETLKNEHQYKQKQFAESTHLFNENYASTTSTLNDNLESKDSKIAKLKSDLIKLNQEKIQAEQRWRSPLSDALDVSQDIYSMKWKSNSRVLNAMENTSTRTLNICEKWELLCRKLQPYPEFSPQVNKLKIRLAQAYSGLGLVERINFDAIDWDVTGLKRRRPEIEAHSYFHVASRFMELQKPDEAKQYIDKAKLAAEKIELDDQQPEKKDYYLAMMHLLDANIASSTDPKLAMDEYLKACELLSPIQAAFPKNTKLKASFVQACINGSDLGESLENAGNAEQLNKLAYEKILKLMGKNPKIKPKDNVLAEALIQKAEDFIRDGETYKATNSLDEARKVIKKAGGNTLLTASVESTQAFIHWDQGERAKAVSIVDKQIDSVKAFKSKNKNNKDALYRLASLYWVKSSMRINTNEAIADGQVAVTHLVELVQSGPSKREAAARRMIAIIYSDIGHQAYVSKQRTVAKKYFEQARQQWAYLSKNWGSNEEYREGEEWCSRRIKSL